MNGSTGFFAVARATNLRSATSCMAGHPDVGGEAPQHAEAALEVGILFWIPYPLQHSQLAGAHDVQHAVTTSRMANDHEVQPRVWPPVTCAVSVTGPTRIVSPPSAQMSDRAR